MVSTTGRVPQAIWNWVQIFLFLKYNIDLALIEVLKEPTVLSSDGKFSTVLLRSCVPNQRIQEISRQDFALVQSLLTVI